MFYLEGFLFCQGQDQSDYSWSFMSAFPLARNRPDKTIILVYRPPGNGETVFTRIKARPDGIDAYPIPKKEAETLLHDYMRSAFTMLSSF